MIKHLFIQNFVLIESLDLDFEEGFSAFTGETGAGKSILIDAISMLKAERAGASFVMRGKDKAIVEGTFDFSNSPHARSVLEEAGLEVNELTTFTREITAAGKSTVRVDRRIVPLSLLRDCLQDEIDIHGQRDNAYLLNPNSHLHLLDAFIQDAPQLARVKEAYRVYADARKELAKAEEETYDESDLAYFAHQIEEIDEADLKVGEEEELQQKEKSYKAMRESYEKVNAVFSLYDDSLSEALYDFRNKVDALPDSEENQPVKNQVEESYYALEDAVETLRGLYGSFDYSEEEVNRIEERLFLIQRLKRRYAPSIEGILAVREELENRISAMTDRAAYLKKLQKAHDKALADYQKEAAELTRIRKERAGDLDQAILAHLRDLMLKNARFAVKISEGKPSAYGSDKAEFMISMNEGEPLKPLSKTASGGELSRFMLGLKVIFTRLQGISTVIFDEIDTGVSGPVATAIGRKMQALSKDAQVFAVTHLAQVAACADSHYFVSKSADQGRTSTHVSLLDEEGRIDQLALIASGEITPASRKAAQELRRRNTR